MKLLLNNRVSAQEGFSLIELLVSIVIALIMSAAIFTAMSNSTGLKRTTTSVNDIDQTGAILSYQLDKLLRSAGSGFSQSWQQSFGCQINASLAGVGTILPFSGTMAAPFSSVNSDLSGVFRLAPLVIANDATKPNVSGASGQTSDALIVMKGNGGNGEVPTLFLSWPAIASLNILNTVGFSANDLVLVTDRSGSTGPVSCMIEQVSSTFAGGGTANILPLAGNYYANPIGSADLTKISSSGSAIDLGNAITNPPSLQIIGIGDNNVLYSYDLLQLGSYNTPQPLADGVFELHALYGVDTDGDGKVDAWIKPTAGSQYDYKTLENGSLASMATLQKIKAVRIGLIMRSSLAEKATVPPATTGPLILFSDLGDDLTYTRPLQGAEQNYRYRTLETTIPLRNAMLSPSL